MPNKDGYIDEWNTGAMIAVFVYAILWPLLWAGVIVVAPLKIVYREFKKQKNETNR